MADEQFHYVCGSIKDASYLFSLNIYSVNLGNGRCAYHLPRRTLITEPVLEQEHYFVIGIIQSHECSYFLNQL